MRQASAAISSYDFQGWIVGVPGAGVTFTIVNPGPATVDLGGLSAIRITGANATEFSRSALASTVLGPGQSTTFTLAFNPDAPASPGARTATVSIVPVSGGRGVSFTVQGVGIDFYVEESGTAVTSHDFGPRTIGVGTTAAFTVHNDRMTSIDLTVSTNNADFAAPAPFTVAAQGTAQFDITFTPSGYLVPLSSEVTVEAADGPAPYTFTLQGMGTSGVFQLLNTDNSTPIPSGTVMDLGNVGMGTSRIFHIHNLSTGSDAVHWTVTTTGDLAYFHVDPVNGSVAAGGDQPLTIAAGDKSLDGGTFSLTLTIQTSDAGHPTFALTMIITQP